MGEKETQDVHVWKSVYMYAAAALVFCVLIIAVINLQVVHGRDNSEMSQRNRLEKWEVPADRGVIFDRNGDKIATNIPSFNVVAVPSEVDDESLDETWSLLSKILGASVDEITAKYNDAVESDPLTKKVLLVQDVDRDKILAVGSHSDELAGVRVEHSSKRNYVGGNAFAHLLGYTGEATEDQIAEDEGVDMGDIVGQDGLEYFYDDKFRGTKGEQIVEIDACRQIGGIQ